MKIRLHSFEHGNLIHDQLRHSQSQSILQGALIQTAASHRPFSDQFQHMADQNPKSILVSQTYCTFLIGG